MSDAAKKALVKLQPLLSLSIVLRLPGMTHARRMPKRADSALSAAADARQQLQYLQATTSVLFQRTPVPDAANSLGRVRPRLLQTASPTNIVVGNKKMLSRH